MSNGPPRWPRWRYGRRLLWIGHDEWGPVEVVTGPLGRSMHFGSAALQGRLAIEEPWRPVAEYLVTMSGAAAFPPPISRSKAEPLPAHPQVCLLGLGTGALAWTYHALLPHAQMTAIELRPAVIEAARACFLLDSLPIQIIEGDAAEEIRTLPAQSQTVISVDLFMSTGMASVVDQSSFWRDISRALHPKGVLCLNAWTGDLERYHLLCSQLSRWVCPAGELRCVDHVGFGNVILFASPQPIDLGGLFARASMIDQVFSRGQRLTHRQLREADLAGLSSETVEDRLKRSQVLKLHSVAR